MTIHSSASTCTPFERNVGFLHPGEMGSALVALATANGWQAHWVGEGRSAATHARARRHALTDVASLAKLSASCAVIVSVCPPHAALDLAGQVAALGFRGIYVDANAISPDHARQAEQMIRAGGGSFVDAAIVGPPPAPGSATQVLLSGPNSDKVSSVFQGPGVTLCFLGAEVGRASAVKICHSAVHKGMLAMQLASLAAAQKLGVRAELEQLWAARASTTAYVNNMPGSLRRIAKAWRFAGEMQEAAQTLEALGLPGGFHRAAAEIYERLSRDGGQLPLADAGALADRLLGPGRRQAERNAGH